MRAFVWLALLAFLCSGCGAYRLNILFRTPDDFDDSRFDQFLAEAERNYRIQKFDFLTIQVFTRDGEREIDPEGQWPYERKPGATGGQNQQMGGVGIQGLQFLNSPSQLLGQREGQYMVNDQGEVAFPQVGTSRVEGLTLYQLDSLLAVKYAKFYVDPLVFTRYVNKRVVVMGALGNKIIPLTNENMTLLEIIAQAGDISENARANRVSIIRNTDTGDPVIKRIDMTTWSGIRDAELIIRPNDVIYIEPRRRIAREFLSDLSTFIAAISSTLTLTLTTVLLLDRLN